jgi:hypothetical protein
MAGMLVSSIQKMESQIIAMGGEVDRFDPLKYRSGLKPIVQVADQMAAAKKVVENTQQVYAEYPIKEIYAGPSKSGKPGVCIKLACTSGGNAVTIQGTVVPKKAFSGSEAIDFIVDGGQGRMTVKDANKGVWEDVTADYEVAWHIIKDT